MKGEKKIPRIDDILYSVRTSSNRLTGETLFLLLLKLKIKKTTQLI